MPGLLSSLIILPLLALPIVLLLSEDKEKFAKWIALGVCSVQFIATLFIYFTFDAESSIGIDSAQLAHLEVKDWMSFSLGNYGVFSAQYLVGLDGLNVTLIVLSGVILLIALIASWKIKQKVKAYFSLFLLLSAAIYGCFSSLDLLVFYIFFEFMLLPMYFLIGIWGGERRQYAAIKFFLYTLVGSVFIFAVIFGLYSSVIDPLATGELIGLTGTPEVVKDQVYQLMNRGAIDPRNLVHTFNMTYMVDARNFIPESIFSVSNNTLIAGYGMREWAFLFLFIGFGVKLPLVPLHTWLPDAHVEAPTPMSVVLAGILLKIGGYGLLRIGFSIFPDGATSFSWLIGFISMVTIVYGAYVALGQKNLKKLIAYSSISHMGFVTLGLVSFNALGISGAIYQMFSHGLISAMLFLIAGVIYERTKNLEIDNYSGLASKMPYFTAFVVVAFFASLGLPGFSGFISEVMVFLGTFDAAANTQIIPIWMVLVSLLGLILTAGYYLWTLQRMFFGKYWVKDATQWDTLLTDVTKRELGLFIVLGILVIAFGVNPSLITDLINPSVERLVGIIK